MKRGHAFSHTKQEWDCSVTKLTTSGPQVWGDAVVKTNEQGEITRQQGVEAKH